MPLTRSFKEFVKSRIGQDSEFRQALFQEAVQALIEGDVGTAKSVVRDYFPHLSPAEVGFIRLRPCLVAKSRKRDFAGRGRRAKRGG
jgi:hypothetical protein